MIKGLQFEAKVATVYTYFLFVSFILFVFDEIFTKSHLWRADASSAIVILRNGVRAALVNNSFHLKKKWVKKLVKMKWGKWCIVKVKKNSEINGKKWNQNELKRLAHSGLLCDWQCSPHRCRSRSCRSGWSCHPRSACNEKEERNGF